MFLDEMEITKNEKCHFQTLLIQKSHFSINVAKKVHLEIWQNRIFLFYRQIYGSLKLVR